MVMKRKELVEALHRIDTNDDEVIIACSDSYIHGKLERVDWKRKRLKLRYVSPELETEEILQIPFENIQHITRLENAPTISNE